MSEVMDRPDRPPVCQARRSRRDLPVPSAATLSRCWAWQGADPLGLPDTAAQWARSGIPPTAVFTDEAQAVDWLWRRMGRVYFALLPQFPARAAAVQDEYRRARNRLLGMACECLWRIRLPDTSHVVLVATVRASRLAGD